MIYSEIFDAMPATARSRVYQRLIAVLSGTERDRKYAHLSSADRNAIVEILRDTKSEFPF